MKFKVKLLTTHFTSFSQKITLQAGAVMIQKKERKKE